MKTLLLALATSFICSWATAQEQNKDEKNYSTFGFNMGTFLPNQIEGVTELLPMWGLKYGFPARKGVVEVGALSAQSMGVSYQNVSLSLRGNIPVDTMVGIVFLGIDGNYYSAPQQPYKLAFGGHFGGGIATHLGDVVWFRADMKFNVNPGTSLYFGFGFEFQIPSEESKDEAK